MVRENKNTIKHVDDLMNSYDEDDYINIIKNNKQHCFKKDMNDGKGRSLNTHSIGYPDVDMEKLFKKELSLDNNQNQSGTLNKYITKPTNERENLNKFVDKTVESISEFTSNVCKHNYDFEKVP